MERRDDIVVPPPEEGAAAEQPCEPAAAPAGDAAVLQRERDEYRDLLLRTSAEFDNYRKRVERERREMAQHAASEVVEGLLPILDDFERALSAPGGAEPEAYRQGVELIYRQLVDFLAKRGVRPFEAVGARFDPHVHEAVIYEERPGHEDGEVVEEIRRGYMQGERLLRPAMVKVAKA